MDNTLREVIPPQNLEAEMAVLGSMLIEEEAIAQVVEILTPESFYKDAHRKIFHCMTQLFNESKAIDLVTLTDVLEREGLSEQVGGPSYLASLTTTVPTAANVMYYARIVKEKFITRFADHLYVTFNPKVINQLVDMHADLIRPEMPIQIQYGTALVLLVFVLTMNVVATVIRSRARARRQW